MTSLLSVERPASAYKEMLSASKIQVFFNRYYLFNGFIADFQFYLRAKTFYILNNDKDQKVYENCATSFFEKKKKKKIVG